MSSRTLFLTALLLLAVPVAAQAQSVTSSKSTLSKSDEDFLTEMPVSKFPGKAEMTDADHDGIVDSEQHGIADPFAPTGTGEVEKPKVIYTYKPTSSTMLRRSIQDDRIEDGYVQSFMQEHGPQN